MTAGRQLYRRRLLTEREILVSGGGEARRTLRRRVTPKGGGANADLLMRTQLIVQLPKRLQLRLQRLTARAPATVRR